MKIRSSFDQAGPQARRKPSGRPTRGAGTSEERIAVARLRTYAASGRVPSMDPSALVHETAVLIGDVRIGPDCYIGPNSVCRGDQGSIVIERGSSLQDCCVVHTRPNGCVLVGEFGQIGHGAMLHGCTIGRNVLIGMGAIVLDEALIEDDAMVGAAALVTARQRVPARTVVRGNPAKVFREVTDEELAYKREITMHYIAFARLGVGMRPARAQIVERPRQGSDVPDGRREEGAESAAASAAQEAPAE